MAGLYFVTLAVLVLAAFFAGRTRARGVASSAGNRSLHSLPIYHGLLAAVAVLVPMLVVYAIATPVVGRLAISNALDFFGPDAASDPLKRGNGGA